MSLIFERKLRTYVEQAEAENLGGKKKIKLENLGKKKGNQGYKHLGM